WRGVSHIAGRGCATGTRRTCGANPIREGTGDTESGSSCGRADSAHRARKRNPDLERDRAGVSLSERKVARDYRFERQDDDHVPDRAYSAEGGFPDAACREYRDTADFLCGIGDGADADRGGAEQLST